MPSSFLRVLIVALACLALPAQNQAGVFTNGTSGSIDVPYSAALFAPAALTVEAWVTYDGSTLGTLNRFPTIARANVSTGWSWFLRVNAGTTFTRQLRWAVRTQNAGVVLVNWTFAPGQLQCLTHVAATYDGTTSRIFINGEEVASAAGGGPIVDNGGTFGIGEGRKDAVFNNEIWNGTLDELRVWSTAMTGPQIKALMFTPLNAAAGLEGSWHLDGNETDSSGNGNNGTVFGAISYTAATLPTQFEYQVNGPTASLDLDGVSAQAFCNDFGQQLVGQTLTLNVQSTLIGNLFDLAVTAPELLVPGSSGAPTTFGGQIVNVDILAPSFTFLFGGLIPFGGNLALPIVAPVPLTAAAQMVMLDPTNPDGIALSGGVEFNVVSCPSSTGFDTLPLGAGNYPLGWSDGGGSAQWTVGTGLTPSGGTGPIAGAFSPSNYIFCETSGPSNATFVMDTCLFDVTTLSLLTLDFRLSRIGATIGTLEVFQDDGSGTFATLLATYSGPEPTMTDWTPESLAFIPTTATVAFRFRYTSGTSFTGDLALDDVSVAMTPRGRGPRPAPRAHPPTDSGITRGRVRGRGRRARGRGRGARRLRSCCPARSGAPHRPGCSPRR